MDVILLGTEQFALSVPALIHVFSLMALAFVVAILVTPLFTDFLYRNKIGKHIRETSHDEKKAPIFYSLHKGKENTPNMGGLLIWIVVAIITILLNLDRAGTWLPLAVLVATGVVGAIDDIMNVRGIGKHNGGLEFKFKTLLFFLISGVGAYWFAYKLDWISRPLHIAGFGDVIIGWWYIPLFMLVLVFAAHASNLTDGLDGLAGGVLATMYAAYTFIALTLGMTSLAAFTATVLGALLAFLWFNIYPARFFMGDTGSLALGMTIAVIAFLTNTVPVFFVIGFIFVIEAASVIIQLASKKFRGGKKVFLSAPIHHHFQAKGWHESKVTMRFWLISAVAANIGIIISLIGRGN
ncbi:MAG: phospho-N-acetylmuramoyl-pentapeptide-transferase [Dehalococcoidales bacterium]|nr:phospho-N-acetylmuramoyl-pentapeptide-transferase [Dehalococcoidales bacterium]